MPSITNKDLSNTKIDRYCANKNFRINLRAIILFLIWYLITQFKQKMAIATLEKALMKYLFSNRLEIFGKLNL